MQIAISFHHIFPHPFLGPEHGRDIAENMILLTDIHPALYVKLSLVTFNNTFIKGGKEDDFLHDGVCRTHMFVNRIRYTLCPCLLYKRKQEANPNPYKQQTFQPQFLLIESGQIYGRICVMQNMFHKEVGMTLVTPFIIKYMLRARDNNTQAHIVCAR